MNSKEYENLTQKLDSIKEIFERETILREKASLERHNVINKQLGNIISIQVSQDERIKRNTIGRYIIWASFTGVSTTIVSIWSIVNFIFK